MLHICLEYLKPDPSNYYLHQTLFRYFAAKTRYPILFRVHLLVIFLHQSCAHNCNFGSKLTILDTWALIEIYFDFMADKFIGLFSYIEHKHSNKVWYT